MSALDRLLPPDSQAIIEGAERFMASEVSGVLLGRDAQAPTPLTELHAADKLGLAELLTSDELGTAEQRLALLVAAARALGKTDGGIAMAVATGAITSLHTEQPVGYAIEFAGPAGPGMAMLSAGHDRAVVVTATGAVGLAELPAGGTPLWGLRLGGAQLAAQLAEPASLLTPEAAATLRNQLALAAIGVAIGVAIGSLHAATDYADQRYQGGALIAKHPAVQQLLANMRHQLALADNLLASLIQGPSQPITGWSQLTAAAFSACEAAVTDGVQVLGGYGYMQEYGQEKRMRDAKVLRLLFAPVES